MQANIKKIFPTIISKTLVFIFVMLFVGVFKSIFREENTLIGVTTMVLMLVLLKRDLTTNIMKNLSFIILLNPLIGIGAFIATQNLWMGIVINFVIMGSIGYLFSYELKNPINMIVGLHYILILTNPVTIEQLPMRLIALISGAFIIMGSQIILNKNKLIKTSEKISTDLEENLLEKIKLIKDNADLSQINKDIDLNIKNLKMSIYESGKSEFHMTKYGKGLTNVLSCLEKLNSIIDDIVKENVSVEFLNEIYLQLNNIKKGSFNDSDINSTLNKLQEENIDSYKIYNTINTLEILNIELMYIRALSIDEKNSLEKTSEIPAEFKGINRHKRSIKSKSNRITYGIRLGILVSVTYFVTNAFNLEFGNWMVYTVFALTQPHDEFSIVKSKKRIVGTIIGAMISFVIFNLIKDPAGRSIALISIGYLMSYVSDYKNIVIFVTAISICSASINISDPSIIILNRLIFVFVGIIIATLANKFILNRKYKDEEESLINMQNNISTKLVEEVLISKRDNEHSVGNLFLTPTVIESRINTINLNIKKEFIDINQILVNDIHQVHLIGNKIYKSSMDKVKNIIHENSDKSIIEMKLKEYIESIENMREKALLNSILTIVKDINSINYEHKIGTVAFAI